MRATFPAFVERCADPHAGRRLADVAGRETVEIWYLSDPEWPAPNLDLLNAALRQTEWRGPEMTPRAWRPAVAERLEALDWDLAASDVRPFLERDDDAALVTKDNALGLLGPRSPRRT